jgi:hypothetical protein
MGKRHPTEMGERGVAAFDLYDPFCALALGYNTPGANVFVALTYAMK